MVLNKKLISVAEESYFIKYNKATDLFMDKNFELINNYHVINISYSTSIYAKQTYLHVPSITQYGIAYTNKIIKLYKNKVSYYPFYYTGIPIIIII